jgi:hypothetical protein
MLANMPHLPRHVEPDIARLCDEAVRVALEHVIRSAGGRANDGMEIFTNEVTGASSGHPP